MAGRTAKNLFTQRSRAGHGTSRPPSILDVVKGLRENEKAGVGQLIRNRYDRIMRANLDVVAQQKERTETARQLRRVAIEDLKRAAATKVQRWFRAVVSMKNRSSLLYFAQLAHTFSGVDAMLHAGWGEPVPVRVVVHNRSLLEIYRRRRGFGGFYCCDQRWIGHEDGPLPMLTLDIDKAAHFCKGRMTSEFARTEKYCTENEGGNLVGLGFRCLTLWPEGAGMDAPGAKSHDGKALKGGFNIEFKSQIHCRQFVDLLRATGVREGSMEAQEHADCSPSLVAYRFMYSFVMEKLILGLILASVCAMAFNGQDVSPQMASDLELFELVVNIIFTVEAALRILAMEGFRGYIRNGWNKLDFVIVIISWVTEIFNRTAMQQDGESSSGLGGIMALRALRAFRALRAIRSMRMVQGLSDTMTIYAQVIPEVLQAAMMLGYFLLLFGTFSVDVWPFAIENQCVVIKEGTPLPLGGIDGPGGGPGAAAINATFADALYNFSKPQAPARFCRIGASSGETGSCVGIADDEGAQTLTTCRETSRKNGQYFGYGSIGGAVLTTFRIAARAPGNTHIVKAVMQSTSPYAIMFYIIQVIVLSSVILSVFVAIVRVTFGAVRKQQKARKEERKKLKRRLSLAKAKQKSLRRASAASRRSLFQNSARKVSSGTTGGGKDGDANGAADDPGKVARHPMLAHFITLMIIVNCIFLAMQRYPSSASHDAILDVANELFTYIFLVEMVIKVIGLGGWAVYLCKDADAGWNCFDCIIVILTCVDLVVKKAGSAGLINLSFLRLARLLRILRLVRQIEELQRIVIAL
eukprot:g6499.t1